MGPGTWAGIARRIRRQWPWPLALEPGSASWQRTGIPKCPCGTEVVPTLCLVQPPALMRCGTNPLDQPRKLPACRSDLPACKEIPPRGRVVPGKVRGASRCRCCAPRPKGRPERTARTATRSRAYQSHCHSALIVPIRYARCRLAVRNALPLAPERAAPHVHRRPAVHGALPRTARRQVRVTNAFHMPPSVLTACYLMPASLLRSSRSCPLPCRPSFPRPRALQE